MLNKTLALCCAALLFAAGCTTQVEYGGEDAQAAISVQDSVTAVTEATSRKNTERCHNGPADENLKLCATYQKSPYDEGYTIYASADVPYNSTFKMRDEGVQLDSMHRLIIIEFTADSKGSVKFTKGLFIPDSLVQAGKETGIRVELHNENKGPEKDDKDLKRRVLLTREVKK